LDSGDRICTTITFWEYVCNVEAACVAWLVSITDQVS
jgi:hypothetical protein